MAHLVSCKTCKAQISSDCSKCPQCGAKQKKSGCALMIIILIILAFFVVRGTSNDSATRSTNENSKSEKKIFDDVTAVSFAQTHLQKKFQNPQNIEFELGEFSVDKLPSPASAEMKKNIKGDLYAIEQNFFETNAFGVKLKHRYRAVVEFYAPKGYRVIMLMIDDVVI